MFRAPRIALFVATVGGLLGATGSTAAGQNSNPTVVSASVPLMADCPAEIAPPSATSLVATCSGSGDGYSATAEAKAKAGRNGSLSTSAVLDGTLSDPLSIVSAEAMYYQYVSLSGAPMADIYRIMLSATATVNIVGGTSMPTVAAELESGVVHGPGTPVGESAGFTTDAGTTTLVTYVSGTNFGTSNTFFYSLFARSDIFAFAGGADLAGSVLISAPTISIFALDGGHEVDITDRYTLTFDPDDAVTATPEPASLALLGTGLCAVAGVVRRRRRRATTAT